MRDSLDFFPRLTFTRTKLVLTSNLETRVVHVRYRFRNENILNDERAVTCNIYLKGRGRPPSDILVETFDYYTRNGAVAPFN